MKRTTMPKTRPELTVSAEHAGDILGITGPGVQKRIKRGDLEAEKQGGQWAIPVEQVYAQKYADQLARKVYEGVFDRHDALREETGQALADQLARTFAAWEDYEDADGSPSDLEDAAWGAFCDAVQQLRDVVQGFVSVNESRSRQAFELALRQQLRRVREDTRAVEDQQGSLFNGDGSDGE